MKKIVYVTGTRADYGLMKSTLKLIDQNRNLDLKLIVTGMHIMSGFGKTVREIKKDGFRYDIVKAVYRNDQAESMAEFAAKALSGFVKKLIKIKPDAVILLGDRAEMLSAAVACLYLKIPAIHIHGGEVTRTFDEVARHAITKLSAYHITATKESAARIKRMGEDSRRIKVFGAPGLDDLVLHKKSKRNRPLLVVLQHPNNADTAAKEMKATMDAVQDIGDIVVIYPNADAGGRAMIKVIERYNVNKYKSLPRKDFIRLLSTADVMVGNSSSGIIEAPFFKLPVVNIGEREKGRQRACNVIDVPAKRDEIVKAVKKALSPGFKKKLKKYKSPYGDAKAGQRIVNFLIKTDFNPDDVLKSIIY